MRLPLHKSELYLKMLRLMSDEKIRSGDEICQLCGITDRFACTGAIGGLRRADALGAELRGRFKITPRGHEMLKEWAAPLSMQRPPDLSVRTEIPSTKMDALKQKLGGSNVRVPQAQDDLFG